MITWFTINWLHPHLARVVLIVCLRRKDQNLIEITMEKYFCGEVRLIYHREKNTASKVAFEETIIIPRMTWECRYLKSNLG